MTRLPAVVFDAVAYVAGVIGERFTDCAQDKARCGSVSQGGDDEKISGLQSCTPEDE